MGNFVLLFKVLINCLLQDDTPLHTHVDAVMLVTYVIKLRLEPKTSVLTANRSNSLSYDVHRCPYKAFYHTGSYFVEFRIIMI